MSTFGEDGVKSPRDAIVVEPFAIIDVWLRSGRRRRGSCEDQAPHLGSGVGGISPFGEGRGGICRIRMTY